MYPYCFFENKIVRSDKPLVRVDDISILRGFAAFDFFRIYNGVPFCFDDHFKRFQNTAKEMGLKIPYSKQQILKILNDLMKKNKEKNFQVKFVLTGGPTKNGILPSKPIFFILFDKMQDLPLNIYKKGAKVFTNEFMRTLPSSKTSDYLNAVLLQKQKAKRKALEILYVNKGEVLECSTSNIFLVKKGVLITPDKNILKGVTRKNILEIAKKNKIKTEERDVKVSELLEADEVFITATNKKVSPITQIDAFQIADGKVGPISKHLLKEYEKLI